MKQNKLRRTGRLEMFDIVVYIILFFVVVITLYPFWQVFIISVNDATDTVKGGLYFIPRQFTLESYRIVLRQEEFLSSLLVSVLRTVIGTPLTVTLVAMASYVLSRKELFGRKKLSMLFIFTMYFGGGLIPYYIVLKALHLIDTFWVFILPSAVDVFSMLLVMTFMRELPGALEEAAMLDGAGHWTIFTRIILPLCLPILATIALFQGIGQWNSWFDSYAFTYRQELRTLPAYLVKILNQYSTGGMQSAAQAMSDSMKRTPVSSDSLRMTTTVLATLPILVLYPFVQKYFVKGIMIGAIKA